MSPQEQVSPLSIFPSCCLPSHDFSLIPFFPRVLLVAAGRNGGHLAPATSNAFPSLITPLSKGGAGVSVAEALKILQSERDNYELAREICEKEGLIDEVNLFCGQGIGGDCFLEPPPVGNTRRVLTCLPFCFRTSIRQRACEGQPARGSGSLVRCSCRAWTRGGQGVPMDRGSRGGEEGLPRPNSHRSLPSNRRLRSPPQALYRSPSSRT